MARQVFKEDGEIEVTATVNGRLKRSVEKINIRPFVTDPARIAVSKGFSFPYGTVKGSVTISLPCYVEEVGSTYDSLNKLVDKLITMEFEKHEAETRE
jgi:hypothetical protein